MAPSIAVTEPSPNAALPVTFWVRGVGTALGGGRLTVQSISDRQGVLQSQEISVNAQGVFEVQVTISQNTPGRIEVRSVPAGASASVPVIFNSGTPASSNFRDLPGGQCQIFVPSNRVPAFSNPDGAQVRTLASGSIPTVRWCASRANFGT